MLLGCLCDAMLATRKPYVLYMPDGPNACWPPERKAQWDAIPETPVHGHACECETSISLANHPHLVKMDAVAGRKTEALRRLDHIPPGRIAGRWYSDFPDHRLSADPRVEDVGKIVGQVGTDQQRTAAELGGSHRGRRGNARLADAALARVED